MIIEYASHDIAVTDAEFKDTIKELNKFNIACVSVFPHQAKFTKQNLENDTKLAIVVDFPLGYSDLNTRQKLITSTLVYKPDIIEIVIPTPLLINRKYDKFRLDVKNNLELLKNLNIELRYTLDYRQISYDLTYKICQILADNGIPVVYPSTSYFIDNLSDNILACALINKKAKDINIMCTGNIWNDGHINLVKKSKIYGIRTNSIYTIDFLHKKLINNKS